MLCVLYFTCILFVFFTVKVCECHIAIKGYLLACLLTYMSRDTINTICVILYSVNFVRLASISLDVVGACCVWYLRVGCPVWSLNCLSLCSSVVRWTNTGVFGFPHSAYCRHWPPSASVRVWYRMCVVPRTYNSFGDRSFSAVLSSCVERLAVISVTEHEL